MTIDTPSQARATRKPAWWRYVLVILVLGSPVLLVVGVLAASQSHTSEAGACQKVVAGDPGPGPLEAWYRKTLIPAAPSGSAVQGALSIVWDEVRKGNAPSDDAWGRLSTACTAVGVDVG